MNETLAVCREVYNSFVNWRTALYETQKRSVGRYEQEAALTVWKQRHSELSTVHAHLLQNVAVRVDLAFRAFFRRVKRGDVPGYPRLKGRGVYDSFAFKEYGNGNRLQGEVLFLSKIGQVRCLVHRPLKGTPKTCTIRRQAGKWFACFSCEYEPEPLPPSEEAVGIDVGLVEFAALSDGTFIENPRFFRRDEKALAKASKKQAGTPKRSPERRKANQVLSRLHERIRNRRHDFVHQEARRLVNRYGTIAVEKLNVRGMVKNPCLAKSISDASWSQFRAVLSYKAESAGRIVAEVNPAFTSQDCSGCGYRAKKPLRERWHFCPVCSLSLDWDTNAAVNILRHALRESKTAIGTPIGTAVGQHSVASALA